MEVFDLVEEVAPGFSESVLHREVLSPPDLERIFGLRGGNIFHGAMSLDRLGFMRPLPGLARYLDVMKGYSEYLVAERNYSERTKISYLSDLLLLVDYLAEVGAHGVVAGPDSTLQEQPADAIKAACAKEGIDVADIEESMAGFKDWCEA